MSDISHHPLKTLRCYRYVDRESANGQQEFPDKELFYCDVAGMSVGLKHSSQEVWALFAAVMCHELVIAFSLGLQFVKSKLPLKKIILFSFMCSIVMPIGKQTKVSEISQNSEIQSKDFKSTALPTTVNQKVFFLS